MQIDKEIYERVKKETMTDYEVQYTKDPDDDYVWVFNNHQIESMLENLLGEIIDLQERFEDYKEYVSENYKQIPRNYYEEYGISEKDFH